MLCYSSSALSAAVGTSESGHNYGHMQLYLLSQIINLALTRAESGGKKPRHSNISDGALQ